MAESDEWNRFFTAPRYSLPKWGYSEPARCAVLSDESGTLQVWTWHTSSDARVQLSAASTGVQLFCVAPSGERVWWFEESDASEVGEWYSAPFDGGKSIREFPDLHSIYPLGLSLAPNGDVYLCYQIDGEVNIVRRDADGSRTHLFESRSAVIEDLSPDGKTLLISHSDGLPGRVLCAVHADGSIVELITGGTAYEVLGFRPKGASDEVLVKIISNGCARLSLFTIETCRLEPLVLDLSAVSQIGWFPDGDSLLIVEDRPTGSVVFTGSIGPQGEVRCCRLSMPAGVIAGVAARPNGDVWVTYSSVARSTAMWSQMTGEMTLFPPPVHAHLAVEDHLVSSSGGLVHALVARPSGEGPYPTVMLLHGGPFMHDDESFSPRVAAWVSQGWAVLRPNYRGSDGYGADWSNPADYIVGKTELEDVAAVRAWAIEEGIADPSKLVVSGGSWGGYLALLAVGIQPAAWSAAIAITPLADYVAAYEDESLALRVIDQALMGGSPDEVPDTYRLASPITYASHTQAPVLVIAGVGDARCPIRQVRNYVEAMRAHELTCELYEYDGGHGPRSIAEKTSQMAAELDFALRHVLGA